MRLQRCSVSRVALRRQSRATRSLHLSSCFVLRTVDSSAVFLLLLLLLSFSFFCSFRSSLFRDNDPALSPLPLPPCLDHPLTLDPRVTHAPTVPCGFVMQSAVRVRVLAELSKKTNIQCPVPDKIPRAARPSTLTKPIEKAKSSQVNTLPIAKSQTRNKRDKDMHKRIDAFFMSSTSVIIIKWEYPGQLFCVFRTENRSSLCSEQNETVYISNFESNNV